MYTKVMLYKYNAKVMFLHYISNEKTLFPVDLDEIIPQDSRVRLISTIIDQLDLSALYAEYSSGREGRRAYHPRMMLKVVIYGYLCNIFSLRGLEEAMRRDAHMLWLSGYQTPDHATIGNFKLKCMDHIKNIFSQIVSALMEMGMIDLAAELYIDGTTIRSRAARLKIVWRSSAERYSRMADEKIQEGVRQLLEQIEEGVVADDLAGQDHFTIEQAREIASKIEENLKGKKAGRGAITAVREACDRKEKHDKAIEMCHGRCGVSPTDPECGIMHAKEDGYDSLATPNYNAQIATQNQFVTNYEVYDTPADTDTALDFIDQSIEENGVKPGAAVEDSGYGSEEVYAGLEQRGIEAVVKFPGYDRIVNRRPVKDGEYDPFGWKVSQDRATLICPNGKRLRVINTEEKKTKRGYPGVVTHMTCDHCEGCPFIQMCQLQKNKEKTISRRLGSMLEEEKALARLATPENQEKLRRRSLEPEPVFGQLKYNKGYQRFRYFGKKKVRMDLGFMLIALNMLKLSRKLKKRG